MAKSEENIVKKTCKELGITQAELARQLGIPPSTIGTWSNVSIPKIAQIALSLMVENKKQREILDALKKAQEAMSEI